MYAVVRPVCGVAWIQGMSADPGHPHRSLGSKMLNTLKPRASILGAVQKLPVSSLPRHMRTLCVLRCQGSCCVFADVQFLSVMQRIGISWL